MKIEIEAQQIEIDLEEVAWGGANGNILAFGKMLGEFANHLDTREKNAGLKECDHFNTFFATFLENIPEKYKKSMLQILAEENNGN